MNALAELMMIISSVFSVIIFFWWNYLRSIRLKSERPLNKVGSRAVKKLATFIEHDVSSNS